MVSAIARKLQFKIDKRIARDHRYALDTYLALADIRDWSKNDLIFDVGANDGRTIMRWRRHLGATRVYAFEPVGSTYRTLAKRTGDIPQVKLFQLGLGEKAERRKIYLHEASALNSFYADRVSADTTEEVEVETLDTIVEREKVGTIQLLKIDAEGHDLDVLKGATRSLEQGKFEIIQVEAGFEVPGKSEASLSDFTKFLRPFGYFLHAITNQSKVRVPEYARRTPVAHGEPWMLGYGDAIFIKG